MNSRRAEHSGYTQLENNDTTVSRLVEEDKIPWYRKRNLRLLYLLMFPTCLGVETTSGFDASMINGLQAVPSWLDYFDHPRSVSLSLMISMFPLGCIVAAPFTPSIVNKLGRRYPILLGSVILVFGSALQGLALNFAMFLIARFILGFANFMCVVAASSLIGELSHPKERAIMGSLFYTSYYIGGMAAAGLTFGTFAIKNNWAWRIPSLFQILPSLFQVVFILFIPESPRWLVSKGRGCEARAILVKYHGEGDENSYFVKAEYAQIKQTLEEELKVSRTSPKRVFSTPGMRKRVIVAASLGLFTNSCGVGLVSVLLSPILDGIGIHDNKTKQAVNLARFAWGLVNGIVISLIVPSYPRRSVYLACTISVFVIFVAWTIANIEYSLTHDKVFAQLALVLLFLYGPAYNLGYTALVHSYLVELFPFHARATGITIFMWSSRAASFFSNFVDPIGIYAAGWKWYIVYCVWDAFHVLFVYLMFPETSGRTLEELTFLYEGEREEFMRSEVGALNNHRVNQTYGAVESIPRNSVQE